VIRLDLATSLLRLFLLFSQLIMNKIPIRNAGPAIVRHQDKPYHPRLPLNICVKINATYNAPARIKTIPPTISRFHDINKTISKINTGILCINKPAAICQKLNSGEITSSENNAKKHINAIDKILGVQYINLFIFVSIYLFYQKTARMAIFCFEFF
jgi:hypothetical protein